MNTAGSVRGKLLMKLADLMERDARELAIIESLEHGIFFFSQPVIRLTRAIMIYRKDVYLVE